MYLSKKSLDNYKNDHHQITNPDNWVSRQLDNHLWQLRNSQSHQVILLVGESGFGKSAAAYRLLEKHINDGGYGFYIPESIIQDSYFLAKLRLKPPRRLRLRPRLSDPKI
jgi:hypothetical protein